MLPADRPQHRIAKLLARAGVASRREVERMIAEGRVAKDGVVLDTPATLLPSLHGVTVDGEEVAAPSPARLFLFHKPAGVLTTERDFSGRRTIYDCLPKDLPRLVPVGRLDLNTEGLLLMTTDGGLKRQLELPATGIERSYRARAYGPVTQAQLEDLIEGVEIEGVRYGSINANLERRTGANVWIEMILTEGKNREVRRVLEYLGLRVGRLIRTRYGPFVLGDLPPGEVGEVRAADLAGFRQTLAKQGAQVASRAAPVAVSGGGRPSPRARAPMAPAVEPERPSARPARPVTRQPRPGPVTDRPRAPVNGDVRRPLRADPADRAAPQRGGRPESVGSGRSDRMRGVRPEADAAPMGKTGRTFAPRGARLGAERTGRPDRARPGRPDPEAAVRPARTFPQRGADPRSDRTVRPDRAAPSRVGRSAAEPGNNAPVRGFSQQTGPQRTGAKPAPEPAADPYGTRPERPKRKAGWAKPKPKAGPTRKGRK